MKIVGYVAAGLAGLALVSALAFYLWLRHDLHRKADKRAADLAAAIAAHGPQLKEDQKLAAELPLFRAPLRHARCKRLPQSAPRLDR